MSMTPDYEGMSHEIWAAAQRSTGEGIEDAAARIESLLRAAVGKAYDLAAYKCYELREGGDSDFADGFNAACNECSDAVRALGETNE